MAYDVSLMFSWFSRALVLDLMNDFFLIVNSFYFGGGRDVEITAG